LRRCCAAWRASAALLFAAARASCASARSSRTQLDRVGPIVGDPYDEDMNMRNWSVVVLVIALAAPAFADATADARAHDEAFAKACEAGDVKRVLALYADNAVVVWPGAGEEAKGKAAIEKLIPDHCNPKNNTKAVIK